MSHDLNHVAIIMDGNNRWAKSKGLSSKEGHKEGVKKAKFAVEFALENKIKFLTLFAFSTENWLRDKVEVKNLLSIFSSTFICCTMNKQFSIYQKCYTLVYILVNFWLTQYLQLNLMGHLFF